VEHNQVIRIRRRGPWLALPAAILANVLLFYLLAAARTTPTTPRVDEERALPVAIVHLPVPEAAEPEIAPPMPEVVPVVSVARPEVEVTALPEPTTVLTPRLLSGIDAVWAELPGLAVAPPGVGDLRSVPSPAVAGIEKPLSVSGVDRVPRRISGALPQMPLWARRAGLEGTVTLRFVVTAEGEITEINVNHIDGDERFGREAIRTATTWGFEPATQRGRPVACWCFQKVSYKLED
jgi:protein TonB